MQRNDTEVREVAAFLEKVYCFDYQNHHLGA